MKKKYISAAEKLLYLLIVFAVGIGYILFFREFIKYSFDIDHHRLFAEKLFHESFEQMSAFDSSIPVHAITYPLYHLTLKAVAFFIKGNFFWASYLVLAASIMLSIILFRKLILMNCNADTIAKQIFADAVSILSVVFVVARGPLTEWRFYAGQCAPNPVHNPTILFTRPFGIISFIAFGIIMSKKEKGEKYVVDLLIFGISTFLGVFAKPNFATTFLPVMGIIVLISMIKDKKIGFGLKMLAAVLPAVLGVGGQYLYMASKSTAVELRVILGGFTGLTPVQVICSSLATFPVVLILFSKKALKENIYYKTAVFSLLCGWLQMFLLSNGPSGDFSWGYDLAVQFATVMSIAVCIDSSVSKWRKALGYTLFAYQAFCGVQYIYLIWKNLDFLI